MSLSGSSRSIFYVELADAPAADIVEEGYAVHCIKPKKLPVSATSSLHRQLHQPVEGRSCILMAGSLEAVVEGLAPPDDTEYKVDCLHMNILLTTYPAFVNTEELLLKIFDKLHHGSSRVNSERLRAALLVTLNAWLGEPFQELLRRPPDFSELRQFAAGCEAAAAAVSGEAAGRLDLLARLARRRLETFGAAAAEAEAAGSDGHGGRMHWRRVDWSELADLQVAEQLTRMDARLFESLQLHECLGSQWGRHRRTGCSPTVDATVRQFNRVCGLVATLALQPGQSPEERAQTLSRWIHIAQYLRERRNFSSLCAIVCTLNLPCLRRLTRLWRRVPSTSRDLLAELSRFADAGENFQAPRRAMHWEGTGKALSRQLSVPGGGGGGLSGVGHARALSNLSLNESSGTVPYLGTFLTDLEGLHSAFPDCVHNGLINFDKRRREYDILARLRLYQVTCRQYQYCEDARFEHWLNTIELLSDEQQQQQLSLEIQPERRNESYTEISSLASDASLEIVAEPKEQQQQQQEDVCIVRFRLDLPADHPAEKNGTSGVCKSVLVRPEDKTAAVIRAALDKHGLTDSDELFLIVQILPGGTGVSLSRFPPCPESVVPDRSNVFYALDSRDSAPVFAGPGSSVANSSSGPRRVLCALRHRQVQSDRVISDSRSGVLRRLLPHWLTH